MRTIEEHKDNTHLFIDGLTVRNLQNAKVTEISDNVDALKNAHNTLAQETQDYWSELAADNNITPEEKKILYKEWIIIQDEYNALLEEARLNGIAETTQELINYKKEYQYLYDYLIIRLKIFNEMGVVTVLSDRETFIQMYNSYYGARDALRSAITDGIVADTSNGLQGQIDKVKEDIQGITQGGVADGSITVDKLAADVKEDIQKFESAASIGFLTDDILNAIDTADIAVKEELKGIIKNNEKGTKLYFEQLADRTTTLIDDANRKTRSRLTQTTDEFKIEIVDMAKKTATQFKQTAKDISLLATNLREETTSEIKVQADRISNIVTSGNTDAYLSLSVGVPYFLTVSKYDSWETLLKDDKQGLDALNAIYSRANTGTEEKPVILYVMTEDTKKVDVKTLTTKLRAIGALSSQVIIEADMIQVNGTAIFNSNNQILQSYIDYTGYATEDNLSKVDKKATDANTAANNADTLSNNFIKACLASEDMWTGTTIIDGGYFKTGLISADAIKAGVAAADKIILGHEFISNKYVDSKGTDGFYMNGETGNFIVNNGLFRGDIIAKGLTFNFDPGNVLLGRIYFNKNGSKKSTDFVCNGNGKANIFLVKVSNTFWLHENVGIAYWSEEERNTVFGTFTIFVSNKPIYTRELKMKDENVYYDEDTGSWDLAHITKNVSINNVELKEDDTIDIKWSINEFGKKKEVDWTYEGDSHIDINIEKENRLLAYLCGFDKEKEYKPV